MKILLLILLCVQFNLTMTIECIHILECIKTDLNEAFELKILSKFDCSFPQLQKFDDACEICKIMEFFLAMNNLKLNLNIADKVIDELSYSEISGQSVVFKKILELNSIKNFKNDNFFSLNISARPWSIPDNLFQNKVSIIQNPKVYNFTIPFIEEKSKKNYEFIIQVAIVSIVSISIFLFVALCFYYKHKQKVFEKEQILSQQDKNVVFKTLSETQKESNDYDTKKQPLLLSTVAKNRQSILRVPTNNKRAFESTESSNISSIILGSSSQNHSLSNLTSESY